MSASVLVSAGTTAHSPGERDSRPLDRCHDQCARLLSRLLRALRPASPGPRSSGTTPAALGDNVLPNFSSAAAMKLTAARLSHEMVLPAPLSRQGPAAVGFDDLRHDSDHLLDDRPSRPPANDSVRYGHRVTDAESLFRRPAPSRSPGTPSTVAPAATFETPRYPRRPSRLRALAPPARPRHGCPGRRRFQVRAAGDVGVPAHRREVRHHGVVTDRGIHVQRHAAGRSWRSRSRHTRARDDRPFTDFRSERRPWPMDG